jgi:phosphate transport system ATP-binding protein
MSTFKPAWRVGRRSSRGERADDGGDAGLKPDRLPDVQPDQGADTPGSMPPPMFALHEVGVRYHGRAALAGVSLEIPPRAITAFIGPSGCGKSSLLGCLNRLNDEIPHCQVVGRVQWQGEDLHAPGRDLTALRRRVGLIFQKPTPFPLSIARNLELPLLELGMGREERHQRIEQVLRDVGLWDEVCSRLGASALGLSGGQQQRLCIARALTLKPEVLLMDEPCSALDPLSSGVVEDLILRLKARYTVVIVTHNLQQARRIADHTGVFWTEDGVGRLVEFGPTAEVFGAPRDPRAAAYVRGLRG